MRKLKAEKIENILFMDIETAAQWQSLDDAPENVRKEWIYKFKYRDETPPAPSEKTKQNPNGAQLVKKYNDYFVDLYEKSAGLYPEFSKVVCITMGYISGGMLKIKSYYDNNESELLSRFGQDLTAFCGHNKYSKLCAHFGKGFDYPFLTKRFLIHRLHLPLLLDNYGLKPWEIVSLDTQEIWKAGGFNSASLSSIAMAFGLPSPKGDIDGGDVTKCFYNGEIERIVTYCEKDVLTLVNIFKCIRGEQPLENSQIENYLL